MNRIRHNSPSPIQCLRAFHILFSAYLLFRCYCYNHYKTQKYYFCYRYRYYHITLLLNTLLQILSYPGVVELTTQLRILENILWLPLCRINKFGLNTLPSKTVAIPYTCRLSSLHSSRTRRVRTLNVRWRFVLWVMCFSDRSLFGVPDEITDMTRSLEMVER